MAIKQKAKTVTPQRLYRYTPLRYPGGKSKLADYVKNILTENDLLDGEYVEPYAGGAGVALELLFHEYVSKIHINDISRPIFSFWDSVLNDTERLVRLVRDTKLTVSSWDKQKSVLMHQSEHGSLELGFATFFLNRTNRSGILNGGIIGGRDQEGPWKIDARYNAQDLIFRIESIAKLRNRIKLSSEDAVKFLRARLGKLPEKTLIYLDPPYYVKGKALYLNYYSHKDHAAIARMVTKNIKRQKWIVSYDNADEIRKMYRGSKSIVYGLGYSAREVCVGSEVMFFCKGLKIPLPTGAMKAI